jgi:hypothetical protein
MANTCSSAKSDACKECQPAMVNPPQSRTSSRRRLRRKKKVTELKQLEAKATKHMVIAVTEDITMHDSNHVFDDVRRNLLEQFNEEDRHVANEVYAEVIAEKAAEANTEESPREVQPPTEVQAEVVPEEAAEASVVTAVVTAEVLSQRHNKLDSAEKHDSSGDSDIS